MHPTAYQVSCLPKDHPDATSWGATVEYRGGDRWAVMRLSRCLGSDDRWSYEPTPPEREGEWLAAHLFDLDTALRLAREAVPHIRVNGFSPADVIAMGERRG